MRRNLLVILAALLLASAAAYANGGPFVVKYPGGDSAAKGVLARIDRDLMPQRERRLRVVREDLRVSVGHGMYGLGPRGGGKGEPQPPMVSVEATYEIENPTASEIEIDFGFPILRGIYLNPFSMMPHPEVSVRVADKWVQTSIVSNSIIYGIIRAEARRVIDRGIGADPKLKALVAGVRTGNGPAREAPRRALLAYLTDVRKWNPRDATLLVEYVGLKLDAEGPYPRDRQWLGYFSEGHKIVSANLGPLGAIGEQKATQLFAQLAGRFDPAAAASYERIFAAWGGDVRERALDPKSGAIRPREISLERRLGGLVGPKRVDVIKNDPTIYARVDYLDETARVTPDEKAALRAILKNLPVVFTFAPMNLLHYRATFPPRSTQKVVVAYTQHAFLDTREPASYQLAYVVHPASLWDSFGPIALTVEAPLPVKVSAPCAKAPGAKGGCKGTVPTRTGELFVAVDADAWDALGRRK